MHFRIENRSLLLANDVCLLLKNDVQRVHVERSLSDVSGKGFFLGKVRGSILNCGVSMSVLFVAVIGANGADASTAMKTRLGLKM